MALQLKKRTAPASDDSPSSAPAVRRPAPRSSTNGTPAKSTFVRAAAAASHRLIVNASGEEKSGKNHFGFTAPAPIYQLSFDIGNEGVVDKFQHKKEILVAEYKLELQPGEASDQEVAESANKLWEQVVTDYRDALTSAGNGTVLVDTDTELWELLRLARFGKLTQIMPHHYGRLNAEMRKLVREAFDSNANVIFLSKKKDQWENYVGSDGKEKGRKTGQKARVGFSDMPFLVQVNASCERDGSTFTLTIDDCRQNPDANGVTIENDFGTLMELVFG